MPEAKRAGSGRRPLADLERRQVMRDRSRLSACIIAMNEADRIGDCLASLEFCDEIVVVDSHSTDATREIAAAAGARVIERDWPGYGAQKEFAIRAAENDWVLCVDADERVGPELREEIVVLRDSGFPGHAGWQLPRLSSYLGKPVRYGTWYPDLVLRLFDRRRGRWVGLDVHERVELEGSIGRLTGDLLHDPYRNLSEHLRTIDRYSTLSAEGMYARGRRASVLDLVTRPAVRFLGFYFLRRGFVGGWRGYLLACLHAHNGLMKYAKLFALEREDR